MTQKEQKLIEQKIRILTRRIDMLEREIQTIRDKCKEWNMSYDSVHVDTAKEFPNGCWLSFAHNYECPNAKIKARFLK